MEYDNTKDMGDNLHSMLVNSYTKFKEKTALIYTANREEFRVTYEKLFDDILILSRAFESKGIKKGSKVMFVCDNRYEWIVTDLAIISLGAIVVPRGSDTPTQELEFIIKHSGAEFLILESETIYNLHKEMIDHLKLKGVFAVEAEKMHKLFDKTYSYQDLLKNRKISDKEIEKFIERKKSIKSEDLFTLIYTSGTTGKPKGVMLTHSNMMYNLQEIPPLINLTHEDSWVSILPSWHIFELAVEYAALSQGCTTVYSSIKTFANDLERYKPTLVATVPRLWESMYIKINNTLQKQDPKKAKLFNKLIAISSTYNHLHRKFYDELPRFKDRSWLHTKMIQASALIKLIPLYPLHKFAQKKFKAVQEKFGGRLRAAISGGGSLPEYLDKWIDAVGIRIVNAYGLTETAPLVAGRSFDCYTFGTIGKAPGGTDIKIMIDDTHQAKPGQKGEIWIRGPQVMPGYYKNEEENKKVFSDDGYFKSGDLGMLTVKNELIITGRSKEIIVLASGENIDPSRIESAISKLPFVADAVLVGQDKKGLGALIVPDLENIKSYIKEHFNRDIDDIGELKKDKNLTDKIKRDINSELVQKNGFKPFEKLQNIHLLDKEFEMGKELTNTYKKKRHIIEQKYKDIIDRILK